MLCWPVGVAAHVKWFADYDLLEPPRQLPQIVSGEYFLAFCLFVAPIVFAVTVIDQSMVVRRCPLYRHSIQLADRVQPSVPMALRLATCIFFLTAATAGAISDQVFILTPELETRHALVAVIQLAIALLALRSHTAYLSGLGIVVLYVIAVTEFGIYYILDYPIFVGVAAYLYFSLIDAIGHFVIIVVLLILVASRNTVKWPLEFGSPIVAGLAHTALFFGLLISLVGIYGVAYCLSYNSVAG